MDIKEFQRRLGDIVELARRNHRQVGEELVRHFFEDENLDGEKFKSIYEYLRAQGIRIIGADDGVAETAEETQKKFNDKQQADPMTQEEEDYLSQYEKELPVIREMSETERRELFTLAAAGNQKAREALTNVYLPQVLILVRQMHRADIFAGDMVQEGNMALWSAVEALHEAEDGHTFLTERIREGLAEMLEQQLEQKWEDACLINRVEKLESAVRELSDGAEDKFSVEELSAFLDMSVEEIRDVLRLTGDNN